MNDAADHKTAAADNPRGAEGLSLSDRVRSLRLPEDLSAAPRPVSWLPWALCLVFALTTALLGFRALTVSAPADAPRKDASAKPLAESSSAPVAASGEVVVDSTGYIVPAHQIQVSPKVSGMIMKLYIEEGKRVKKDEVLAELERTEYEAERDRAQAALNEVRELLQELTQHRVKEVDQAKARWEEAAAQGKQLELDRKRSSKLRHDNALAERDFEQAESAYMAMVGHEKSLRLDYELLVKGPRDNKIDAVKRKIRQLEADLTKAEWRLDNCTVRAPLTGTILTKIAEEGNIVNQLSMNLKGSLCDMADLSDLEVDLSIQEREIARVFQGQRCRIRSNAYPDRTYEGYVSRLMPIADRAKGAITVRVKVTVPREEEGVYLKPEMGVVVWFLKGK